MEVTSLSDLERMEREASCSACRGNVAPDRFCYACGLKGPAGEGKLMCPKCRRFGPHECSSLDLDGKEKT